MKKILKGTSFISTVYNEEDSIQDFLESLKSQTVLPGEIIIVDGGSKDNTFSRMEVFFGKWALEDKSPVYISPDEDNGSNKQGKVAVKLISSQGAGISRGRNIAIGKASGETISVSDAGCILDPGWLEEINRGMDKDPGRVNGGMNYSICKSMLQRLTALAIMPGFNETDPESFMPSSRNLSFRKTHWKDVGGYPEDLDFGEDMKFDFNLKSRGYNLVFSPAAAVYWKMRESLAGISRQFFRYAKGDGLGRMYPLRHMIRFFSGALFLAVIIYGILISPWIFMAFIILGGAYCYKPYYRLFIRWDGNEGCRPRGLGKLSALILLPLLLIFIDSSKVFGYLYGLFMGSNKAKTQT
jgi:glycosyltransferase involved in cell wall biosynthesis